jgi:hypothetical protein
MAICQAQPFFGQLVYMGCFDYGIAVAPQIPISQIIRQEDDDIGFASRISKGGFAQGGRGGKDSYRHEKGTAGNGHA